VAGGGVGWGGGGCKSRHEKDIFWPLKLQDHLWGPPRLPFGGHRALLSPEVKLPGIKLTTHLSLLLRLRMSGAEPPLPPYACMECVRKTLPFPFTPCSISCTCIPRITALGNCRWLSCHPARTNLYLISINA
jgi:hypothetical protein